MEKTCSEFMASYVSKYVNCLTCRYWDTDELTCLNPEEVVRRKKAKEFRETDKMMKKNKGVVLDG